MYDDLDDEQRQSIERKMALLNGLQAATQTAANAANIYKPGAISDGQVDRSFAGYKQQAMKPETDTIEARKRKFEDQKFNLGQQDLEKSGLDLKNAQDASNGDSEYSQLMRKHSADALRQRAAIVSERNPSLGVMMTEAADGLFKSNVPAMHVGSIMSPFGDVAKDAISEGHAKATEALAGASLNQKVADQTHDNAHAAEVLGLAKGSKAEDARHNRAMEGVAAAKADLHITKPQEKLNQEISNLEQLTGLLKQAKAMKGGVNTGPIANTVQKLGQKVGISTDKYDNLQQLMATINNKIIKEFAGSAVSPAEMYRIQEQIATLDKDDPTFDRNIDAAIEQTIKLHSLRTDQYQRSRGGAPIDQSVTASKAVSGEGASKPAPHGQRVKQNGKTFEWNGSKYVEVQ